MVSDEWQHDILTVVQGAFTKAKKCVALGDVQDSDGHRSSTPSTLMEYIELTSHIGFVISRLLY